MIFTAQQLQEKCHEQYLLLYMAFINLTDSINRTVPRCALSEIGFRDPKDQYLKMLRLLHENMTAMGAGNGGTETAPFRVDTGVKQS